MTAHPNLFAGFNTAPNNGDDVDGSGIAMFPPGAHGGTGMSPDWVSTMTSPDILIITEEMMSIFATECPDLIIRGQPNTVVFPAEIETLTIRGKAA